MRQRTLAYAGLLIALLGIWLVYSPGLTGGFLFDDFANLPTLGATGPIDNGPALARYLTSSTADPTGRPVTVATFLLDARDWPADPLPFKRTNLLIHLANTILLACLLFALGRRIRLEIDHARNAAFLGAAIWGLHPLFVSTTLYIIQREAMLPVSFTLTGLLLWLSGRYRMARGQIACGVALEFTGLGLGTLLATLSKANGALLPLYALLIEHLLLLPNDAQPMPRAHRMIIKLLWLPTLTVITYLLHSAITHLGSPMLFGRDWTLNQRLLSEPRILFDYLHLLWLPHPFTNGLFNDQVQVSVNLLQPWTTLPALLGIIGLIIAAWILRRQKPLWALAVLFYFSGHLIESSAIPLELYFEHRNYLPALLMFWPLAIWLVAPGETQRPRLLLAVVILCGLGAMTRASTRVWGDTTQQALLWAQLNPESPRAQSYAAQIMMSRGQAAWAEARLRPLLKQAPNEIQIAFNLLGADCTLNGVTTNDLEATRQALSSTRRLGALSFQWLGNAIERAKSGSCPGLTFAEVETLLNASWNNPTVRDSAAWQQDILNLRGKLALAQRKTEPAYQHFAAALILRDSPAATLEQAATLGTAGQQGLALCELALWEQRSTTEPKSGLNMVHLHDWVLARQNYWPNEIAHLRQALRDDLPEAQRKMPCPNLAFTPKTVMTQNAQ